MTTNHTLHRLLCLVLSLVLTLSLMTSAVFAAAPAAADSESVAPKPNQTDSGSFGTSVIRTYDVVHLTAGVDYVVTFTTPNGITAPEAMTINSVTGATLPTAVAPEGYTFLGWVLADYDNVTVQPSNILTGLYKPTADITLKALYTFEDDSQSGPQLSLMDLDDTFSDGDKIVITAAGTNHGLYRESNLRTYAKDFDFTGDAADILSDAKKYFPVKQVNGGWWLGDDANLWLYTPSGTQNLTLRTYNQDFMTTFTLTTYEGHHALMYAVSYNNNRFYLKCGTDFSGSVQNNWRMINLGDGATPTGIVALDIYKLTEGSPAVTRYTTVIDLPHTHTPAAPVIENEVPATCTAAGSYDSVVYCSECGEEISRETVGIPALGHNWSAWTSNNDGTHSRTCSVCSETETHDCEFGDDDVCDVCGYERSTEMDLFIGMTLSLEGATCPRGRISTAASRWKAASW